MLGIHIVLVNLSWIMIKSYCFLSSSPQLKSDGNSAIYRVHWICHNFLRWPEIAKFRKDKWGQFYRQFSRPVAIGISKWRLGNLPALKCCKISSYRLNDRLKDGNLIFSGQLYQNRWPFIRHSNGFPTVGAGWQCSVAKLFLAGSGLLPA